MKLSKLFRQKSSDEFWYIIVFYPSYIFYRDGDPNARHASVHFSSDGDVSIKNLSAQQKKKKTFGKLKSGTNAHPVSLQRLFNTSTSEMGESVMGDLSIDNSQVSAFFLIIK